MSFQRAMIFVLCVLFSVSTQSEIYVISEGETLWSVAEKELGDPYRWKEITLEDGSRISNPIDIKKGTELKLPPIVASDKAANSPIAVVAQAVHESGNAEQATDLNQKPHQAKNTHSGLEKTHTPDHLDYGLTKKHGLMRVYRKGVWVVAEVDQLAHDMRDANKPTYFKAGNVLIELPKR